MAHEQTYAALPRLTFRPEHVVIEETFQYVHILGERFELTDLLRTMEAVMGWSSSTLPTNKPMLKILQRIGALRYTGSHHFRTGATLGPNGTEFINKLRQRLNRVEEADDARRKLMRE